MAKNAQGRMVVSPFSLVRLVGVIGWMKGKHKMHTYYI